MTATYPRDKEVSKISKGIIEAVKEGLRLALFGAVAYLISYLLQYFGTLDQTENVVITGTFILRIIDKYLYEAKVVKKGLSQF